MSSESRALRVKRAKLIEDARELTFAKVMTPEMARKYDAMMAKADDLKAQIDRLERADKEFKDLQEAAYRTARGEVGPPNATRAGPGFGDPVAAAFDAYLRNGMEGMTPEMRAVATSHYRAAQG